MTDRALVIGEALIDIVERNGEVTGEHVGGSPLNVAVGLGRLDRGVDFLTRIGADERGRRIAAHLADSHVTLVAGSTDADRTPTARAMLDAGGSAKYEFDIDWRLAGTPEVAPPLVVHTGSIATVLEPGCRATAALVDTYRPASTVTFDPNIRPVLIDDAQAARDRIDRLVERCDVVKVSDEDLRWLDPNRSPKEMARAWLSAGPSIVAVTMGDQGAFAMCQAGTARVAATPVKVVDTVGAGDAFMAGLIDALWTLGLLGAERRSALRGIGLEALHVMLQTAALSSALTVAKAGADLPDRVTRDQAGGSAILG